MQTDLRESVRVFIDGEFRSTAVFLQQKVVTLHQQNKTSMEKINLCEGVVAQMMDTEAWGNVSGDFPFSEAQLEKYADKLDWKEVSGNTNIFWSVQMLEKFKRRIDWTALSRCLQEENVSAELLEKFKDNWNLEELSDNNCLTPELIDQFADYINWKALINNWSCCEKLATEEFIRKYSDRIPACDFKDSRLWREMVEKKEKEIKKLICLC